MKKKAKRMMVAFMVALLLSAMTFSCKKDKKDGTMELVMLWLLLNSSGLNFSFPAAASSASYAGSYHTLASTVTIPQGDGLGDNYADVLLTPSALSLHVCDVVGYLPESEGGPAAGTETFENGTSVASREYASGNNCNSAFIAPIYDGTMSSMGADLSEMGTTYDRIGIVLQSVNAFFPAASITDPNRRYWSAQYSNSSPDSINFTPDRGFVRNAILGESCSAELATNGGLVDTTKLKLTPGCTFTQVDISIANGKSAPSGLSPRFAQQYIQMVPIYPDELRFNLPSDISRFADNQAYVVVLPVTEEAKKENGITVDVYRENMLFYDSTDGNEIFSP